MPRLGAARLREGLGGPPGTRFAARCGSEAASAAAPALAIPPRLPYIFAVITTIGSPAAPIAGSADRRNGKCQSVLC